MSENYALPIVTPDNIKKIEEICEQVIEDLEYPPNEEDWNEMQHSRYFEVCRGRAFEAGLGDQFDIIILALGQEQIQQEALKHEPPSEHK